MQNVSHRPFAGVVLSFLLLLTLAVPSMARSMPGSFADLAEEVSPAVVNISTTSRVKSRQGPGLQFPPGSPFEDFFEDFFGQRGGPRGPQPDGDEGGRMPERKVTSLGSGFVIHENGTVVTNNHVIADADEIMVIFPNGDELEAEIVGRDPKTDIAVLKVDPKGKKLKAVRWGNSSKARVGDWVVAIGNPLGLGGSVTAGIISARNRDINAGPYDDFIQTDAPINRGNSGGPLFDLDGQVIGVNTAIISPNGGSIGIGFAVPSDLARQIVSQLQEHGETRRGWLGVRIQEVTDDIAEGLGLDKPRGALVAEVTEDGPSDKGGIKVEDVILSFDGRAIKEMRDLPRMVADTPIGKKVQVVVWRNGKRKNLRIELGRLEEGEVRADDDSQEDEDEPKQTSENIFGMRLEALTDRQRERYDMDEDQSGVVVTRVQRGSAAEERGVRPGMLVVKVGGRKVGEPEDVLKRIEGLKAKDRPVALFLMRTPRGDGRFVSFRLDNDE
ncbi:MAG: DegQ family serine endoprotease [Alphaproteobacteria bacterium]